MKAIYLLLLLLPLSTWAQKKKDTSIIYLDQNLQLTNAKQAAFAGVSLKVEGGWMVYAVYPDTTPLIKAYFTDRQLTNRQGPFTIYYPKNIKAREGYYNNNKMTGTWRFWHPNGQLKDSGAIDNNNLSGLWRSWHPNGQLLSETLFKDKLTATEAHTVQLLQMANAPPPYPSIRHGAHKSWYSNGQLEATGQFADNKMQGTWKWYRQNGTPATEEEYKDGVITSLTCFDDAGRPAGDMCSIDKPAVLKHFGDYKAFVYENMRWPEEARRKKIQGDVKVQFTVGTSGTITSLVVTSPQPVLKKAVEDLFAQMKEWDPAISHNRVVEFTGEMIIPFWL